MQEGKFFDKALLGDTNYEMRYERSERVKNIRQVPTRDGFALAEKFQPEKDGRPDDPKRPFPRDLRKRLIEKLEKYEITPEKKGVRYFTAVGCAPLDDYNGIDFYFKIKMPGGERIITIDVSFRGKPDYEIRADVFRQYPDDFQSPPERPAALDDPEEKEIRKKWDDEIESLASELAAKLFSSEKLQMEEDGAMTKSVFMEPKERYEKRMEKGIRHPADFHWK